MTKPGTVGVRDLVLDILVEVLEKEAYSSRVIHDTLRKYQYLEKQDRAFLSRLSEGTIERCIELDYIIDQYSKVKTRKMKPVIRNILRMGTFQILYMDQVPDSAACNEAVKLAVRRGFQNLKGFVNGVLRTIARQKACIHYPDGNTDPAALLSVRYSLPEWLVTMWMDQYGADTAEAMGKAALVSRPTTIRCNLGRTTKEKLAGCLKDAGIRVEDGTYLPYALRISGYDHMERVPGFQEGWFQVQDESSMLAVEAAGIKEGGYIIDVCGAPGGKSLHAAEKLNGTGRISARDLTEYKLSLIEENKARHKVLNMEVKEQDARESIPEDMEAADIVIADLPCSGLGVIGKKSDIKYKTSLKGLKELVKLQREILKTVSGYVKPGGTLIFSTCTVNKEENEYNYNWFLEEHPMFYADSLNPYLPEALWNEQTQQGCLQLYPGVQDTDGFFIARFRKKDM